MKHLAILFVILSVFAVIIGCAKASDPAGLDNVLVVDAQSPVMGDPIDFEVTDDYIFTGEDLAGFAIRSRSDLSLLSQNTELEVDIRNVKYISVVPEYERIFVYNTTGSDGIYFFSYADPTDPVFKGWTAGNTQNLGDIEFLVNPHDFPEQEYDSYCDIVGMRTRDNQFLYGYLETHGADSLDIYQGSPLAETLYNDLQGMAQDQDYFYLTGEQMGLYIMRKSDMTVVGQCDTPGEALRIVVNGDYAYIADKQDGLAVIDITDRANPVLLTTGYNTTGYAQSIDFENNWLVVGSGGGGVYLFDITNPADPKFVDRVTKDEIGYTRCVDIHNGLVYVASRDNGVVQLSIHP